MTTTRVALANLPYPESPEQSVARAVRAIADAGRQGAAIICFPEGYVPGYRATVEPQFSVTPDGTHRVAIFVEVEGAGDFFPPYAGNLDIMTAAAVRVGEALARERAGAPA